MSTYTNGANFDSSNWPRIAEWHAFIEKHFADSFKEYAKDYVTRLIKFGLPPVFDLHHIGRYTGIEHDVLSATVRGTASFYRFYEIPKRAGGKRRIAAPLPSLLHVQRWMLKNILENRPLQDSVHGFRRGRSVLTNALPHVGARCVLKVDLLDFFPSIKLKRVAEVFLRLGYAPGVSWDFSRLATLEDALPQGGATSPAIANIVATPMDRRLGGLAEEFSLSYTRYADDLTFSGEYMSLKLSGIVQEIVAAEGFQVNAAKTRLMRGSSRKIVTGVSIGSGNPRLPRETRRQLKAELNAVMRDGIETHISKRLVKDAQFVQRLLGETAFWLQVEPANVFARRAHAYLAQWQRSAVDPPGVAP